MRTIFIILLIINVIMLVINLVMFEIINYIDNIRTSWIESNDSRINKYTFMYMVYHFYKFM